MSDPWESAEFLIKRAHSHATNFNLLAKEFFESNPYTVTTDLNTETGLREIKVKIVREFSDDLRGSASDAVKNIRDALDQIISAATFVLTGKRPRGTHFPFGETEGDLENSLSRRKAANCRHIPEELFPVIRFIKPYPHQGDNFRLKLLQKVSGPHKHSVALTLGCAPTMPFSDIRFGPNDASAACAENSFRIDFPEWDGTKEEVVIATYTPEMEGQFDASVPLHIAFDYPEMRRTPAAVAINQWGSRTDWIRNGMKKTVARLVAERTR